MSVWQTLPCISSELRGDEGQLVSVSVTVEPRSLEALLETLSELSFPINPQINHETAAITVRFPAYTNHLPEIRNALEHSGASAGSLWVRGMLEQIRSAAV